MQMNSSQPRLATLHSITLPYTLRSGNDILLTSLTKLQLQNTHITYQNTPTMLKAEAIGLSTDSTLIQHVDVDEVYNFIISMSLPTIDVLRSIKTGLLIIQEEKYSTPDFQSCQVCQDKGLDTLRNCPMLDNNKHSKGVVYTFKNDSTLVLKQCPMYDVNQSEHLVDALNLMTMFEHNALPTSGGLLDQTVFVNEVLPLVKPLIDKKNQPMRL